MLQQNASFEILQQIHNGETHMGEYLSLLFKDMPIAVCWKDLNSVHLGCNQVDADMCGLSHVDEMIGKTDFDVCRKEEDAIAVRTDDQMVISTGIPRFNDIRTYHHRDGQCSLMSVTKLPTYNRNKEITGVTGFFSITPLSKRSTKIGYLRIADFCRNDLKQCFQNGCNYFIVVNSQTINLTARQAECLTCLAMRKTIKQVASTLDCSTTTVEDHIDRLKSKLGVCTTSGLIDRFWSNPIRWF